MNFQQLRFAVSVAETASFSKAADICCVTQPALSNAIAQLEEELGGKLFDRTTRSVVTTEFGVIALGNMRLILEAKQHLLNSAADYQARDDRTLRIGLSPLISADFSRNILARAAKAGLTVILTEMNKADQGPALLAGTIDFGLCPAPHSLPGLDTLAVYSEPLLYVSDQVTSGSAQPIGLKEIAARKLLLVSDDCGLADTVRDLIAKAGIVLDEYEGRALGYHVLERWAQMGIGVALLPASQVTDMTRARPVRIDNSGLATISFEAHWAPTQELRRCFASARDIMTGSN